jgi:hypothetical protein
MMMNRRESGSPMDKIEDLILVQAFEAAEKMDFNKVLDEILK